MLAPAPLTVGSPTVTDCDDATGGLHDGNAKGGPCVRFGVPHALKPGTNDTLSGLALFGRTWPALATEATANITSAPTAKAMGSTILFLMVI
jgi:hypothetical protein